MSADELKKQCHSAVQMSRALMDSIRDLGRVPAGNLYAVVMGHIDLPTFERLVTMIVESGLVVREGHELVWKGVA